MPAPRATPRARPRLARTSRQEVRPRPRVTLGVPGGTVARAQALSEPSEELVEGLEAHDLGGYADLLRRVRVTPRTPNKHAHANCIDGMFARPRALCAVLTPDE